MKNDKKISVDDQTHIRIQRVSRLPEPYLTALEQITDELQKDIMNRLVQTMYVDELCTRFEAAIAEGKSVEELVGTDIPAFVEEYQKEVDFRDATPSEANQNTNLLMLMNFMIYLGLSSLLSPCTKLFIEKASLNTLDMMLLGFGFILLVVSFILKFKQYKKSGINIFVLVGQIIVLVLVLYFLQFDIVTTFIGFGVAIVSDLIASSYSKIRKV